MGRVAGHWRKSADGRRTFVEEHARTSTAKRASPMLQQFADTNGRAIVEENPFKLPEPTPLLKGEGKAVTRPDGRTVQRFGLSQGGSADVTRTKNGGFEVSVLTEVAGVGDYPARFGDPSYRDEVIAETEVNINFEPLDPDESDGDNVEVYELDVHSDSVSPEGVGHRLDEECLVDGTLDERGAAEIAVQCVNETEWYFESGRSDDDPYEGIGSSLYLRY